MGFECVAEHIAHRGIANGYLLASLATRIFSP